MLEATGRSVDNAFVVNQRLAAYRTALQTFGQWSVRD